MNNLKIIIAGPGAGKTHNLKEEVINSLNSLDRNRFCAVITYTNAATAELRQRISSEIPIPLNLFIGTIHSFLIRFIIEPYGHLVGKLPIEKIYIESVLLNYKPKNIFAEKNTKQKRAIGLVNKGIVAYDMIVSLSKNIIIQFPTITKVLVNRLQYIFIDEYQDSRIYIHEIFQELLSFNYSYITIIGDPLQAIFSFTYSHSLIRDEASSKPKLFSETPMMVFESKFINGHDKKIRENYRASHNLVTFTNNFLKEEYKQTSIKGDNGIPVYFINKYDSSEIYEVYKQLKNNHNIDNLHNVNLINSKKPFLKDLILTKEWIDNNNTNHPKYNNIYNIIRAEVFRLEKGDYKISGVLQEISRCILAVTGVKKQDFIKSVQDEIEYRKFCFCILRHLINCNDIKSCIVFIRKHFEKKYNIINNIGNQVDVEKSLKEIVKKKSLNISNYHESCYSSIHSAKGLEATSVLAIAYNENELKKWLNFEAASTELNDDFRLGYVAFTRASEMLCIACLEQVSNKMISNLKLLNVSIYSCD